MRSWFWISVLATSGLLLGGSAVTPARATAAGANGGGRPLWSPDGHGIAFVSGTPNTPANTGVIDVGPPGRSRQLTWLGARPQAWSSDGKTIYCQTMREGRSSFRAVEASNGRERPILAFLPGDVTEAVWSPDGTQVAYLKKHDDHRDLWAARPTGADQRRLAEGLLVRSLNWSRDSKRIAFDVGGIVGEATYVVESHGKTGPTRVFKGMGSYPSWSPDGSRIALLGMHTVTLVSKDGRNSRRLHVSQVDRSALDWSPDSAHLVYVSSDKGFYGISTVEVNTGRAVRLSSGWAEAALPRWSPDGRYIAFEAAEKPGDGRNLYLLEIHGQRRTQLTRTSPSSWNSKWSGDGAYLYFLSNAGRDGAFQLCRSKTDGTAFAMVTPADPGKPLPLRWPRRAKQGVLVIGKEVKLLPATEAPQSLLTTEHPTSADLSPRGDRVAYVKWVNHKPSLVIRELDSQTERELLPPPSPGLAYSQLSWSPDGKQIAFVQNGAVCKVAVEDGAVSVLFAPGPGEEKALVMLPAWSPDSKWIVFGRVRQEPGPRLEIRMVSGSGKLGRLVADGRLRAEGGILADPLAEAYAWSPDSTRLVFGEELDGTPALYLISLEQGTTRPPKLLKRAAAYPSWALDGKQLTYTSLRGNREQIHLLGLSDGRDRPLELRTTGVRPVRQGSPPRR